MHNVATKVLVLYNQNSDILRMSRNKKEEGGPLKKS